MSLCTSIDTLSMAYLDDELAAEERHELEAHLSDCAPCRAHLERERADLSMVRRALVVPPASDLLRAKIARALDDEDRTSQRGRWSRHLLSGSAIVAAAAAIVMFIAVQAPTRGERVAANVAPASRREPVVHEAARQSQRSLPLEVQGASTGPWLQEHFASGVEPPQFGGPTAQLLGARLLPGGIDGHDAALMSYRITSVDRPPFVLSVIAVSELRGDDMKEGAPVRVNGRLLYVYESRSGENVVSYVNAARVGYMFIARELSVTELVGLVSQTSVLAQ